MNWMRVRLTMRAWLELALYDLAIAREGFGRIHRQLERQGVSNRHRGVSSEALCAAVDLAACFYVKRVYCLQRSAVAVRMLRQRGIAASLVIAYRPSPFFSHAWAEVAGKIVNDSTPYSEQLTVLYRQEPRRKGRR